MAQRFLHLARHGEAAGEDGGLTATGRRQADLLGQRLAGTTLSSIHHSPVQRAVETARLVGAGCPRVPLEASPSLGDYVPPVPDRELLPAPYRAFLAGVSEAELQHGAALAAAAVQEFAGVPELGEPNGEASGEGSGPPIGTTHQLVVTHAFLIGWFVRDALGAADERWLGLNAAHCALTTILYRPDRPPALVAFNEMSHLPDELQWTGFPADLRPG